VPDLSKGLQSVEGSDGSIGMQHCMDIHISVPAVLIQKSMHIDC